MASLTVDQEHPAGSRAAPADDSAQGFPVQDSHGELVQLSDRVQAGVCKVQDRSSLMPRLSTSIPVTVTGT